MIATCSVAPSPFLPLAMSSSSDSGRSRRSHDRPVLPPIRDLFRELSSSRISPESPALTLARLRVSDEEDPRHAYGPPQSRPSSTRPPSRSNADPSAFVYPQPSRFNAASSASYERSRSSSHDPRGPYPIPDFHNAPSRTMSYDRAAYPPSGPSTSYPVHRNSVPAYDPRHDPRGYNSVMMSQSPPQSIPPYYARTQPPSNAMPPAISTGIYGTRGEDDDRTPVARYQPSGMAGFAPPDASTSGGPSKYECTYCGKGFSRPSSLKIHLNSHTGEKPFVCPVDGCGRSFSVLSNMRRHARVHTTPMMPGADDGATGASPLASSSHPAYNATTSSGKWKHRRNSSASASSSSSRRSHSVSSDEEGGLRPFRETNAPPPQIDLSALPSFRTRRRHVITFFLASPPRTRH
ncbi:hypothetical protein MVEN_00517300 [Mycena venus]|uniref:C2H2-type domain-containing protein n=1 Tax=Mycena venus TaxID=2733690 RepID=A0A8H7D4C0_9AGAR|nr:hypothetical protein MVEN_00517300 [Mycena venus]